MIRKIILTAVCITICSFSYARDEQMTPQSDLERNCQRVLELYEQIRNQKIELESLMNQINALQPLGDSADNTGNSTGTSDNTADTEHSDNGIDDNGGTDNREGRGQESTPGTEEGSQPKEMPGTENTGTSSTTPDIKGLIRKM